MTRAKKIFFGFTSIGLLAIVAVWFVLTGETFRTYIQQELVLRLEKATGGKVSPVRTNQTATIASKPTEANPKKIFFARVIGLSISNYGGSQNLVTKLIVARETQSTSVPPLPNAGEGLGVRGRAHG